MGYLEEIDAFSVELGGLDWVGYIELGVWVLEDLGCFIEFWGVY